MIRVITGPSFEPVTLEEARLWCRVDHTEEDAKILMLITAMREYAETLTGRAFAQRTLEYNTNAFPDEIVLPYAPLQSVTSIHYTNSDGTLVEWTASPTEYQVDTVSEPGKVMPAYGYNWPTALDAYRSIRVRYVAGYAHLNAIPRLLRLWMETRIATFFAQREQLVQGSIISKLPRDFTDGLLDSLNVRKRFA